VQKALPLLPDGASIVLNSSIVGSKGLSSNSVYSATTAAIRSFARTWTTDLKDRQIRVNAISPGSIDTPGLGDLLASTETGEERKKMIEKLTPLGWFGTPDEIAKAVVLKNMAGTTGLEPAASAVTVSWFRVLSTTWKSTDGTRSHWKYMMGNVIVYRNVYRADSGNHE
jgi:NAD(P)-dependent dehydrogenase (short-subunit alcohol dehydrogenase family)